jgi:adenylate cyclase
VLPKKAQALLAFLLLNRGRQIARNDLAALLWSNTASDQSRQSLRQCLSVARRAIPQLTDAMLVQTDALTLQMNNTLACDIDELERLRDLGSTEDLARADALFRGEFLEGLSLPHEPFDDWAASERQRLRQERQKVLSDLARLHAESGDPASAIETAKRLTLIDPFREDSSRQLMELLALNGQRGLALIEHTRLERLLREELELVPDVETRRLADMIKRGVTLRGEQPELATALPTTPPVVLSASSKLLPGHHHLFPGRPVIALLPFANLTGNPAHDTFVQGLTEDVASALVRDRWPLIVTTPFVEATGLAQLQGLRSAIGAKYVVRASLRQHGTRPWVLVRVMDTIAAWHVWSGRVEAEAGSLFDLHERLCGQVVSQLAPAVHAAEIQRAARDQSEDVGAYDLYLRASAVCRQGPAGNSTAFRLLRRAVELDPNLGVAYALAARCLHLRRLMGWSHPEDPILNDAVRLAHRALEVDGTDPEVLWMAGLALANVDGNLSDGRGLLDRSLTLNPHNASAWIASCFVHAHSGNPAAALQDFERAQEVNPDDSSQHVQWHAAATALFIEGRYEEANQASDKALAQMPSYPGSLRMKVATCALLGRSAEAENSARRLLQVNPDASVAIVRRYWQPWVGHTPDAIAAMLNGWRRTAMPEG